MMMAGVAARQLGPNLIAGDIGGEHLAAAKSQGFCLGQDRREQHRRDMAAAADIVVVERVAGGAVDPGRFGRGRPLAGKIEAGRAGHRRQPLAQQLRRRVVRAGDHRRDRVDDAGAGGLDRRGGQFFEAEAGDEPAEFLGQRHF